MHLSTEEPAGSRVLEPFGEVGRDVPENFHREHILLKLKIKSYCEKLGLKLNSWSFALCHHISDQLALTIEPLNEKKTKKHTITWAWLRENHDFFILPTKAQTRQPVYIRASRSRKTLKTQYWVLYYMMFCCFTF